MKYIIDEKYRKGEFGDMYAGPSLRRIIYSSKNLSLYSFGSMPVIAMTPGSERTTYSLNASVMLGLSLDKSRIVGHYTNGSVFISPTHHPKVVSFLNQALGWFYDDKYKDLFYHNENSDNELTLNKQKYPDLRADCYFYGKKDPKSLSMSPIVVDDNGSKKEGVILIFNNSQSYALLPYYELESLLFNLMDFSFQQEINLYLTMLPRIDEGKFQQGFDYTKNSTHQSRSSFTKNQIQW